MRRLGIVCAAVLFGTACGLPFGGPKLASTADLINGAADTISNATGLTVTGTFAVGADNYSFNMDLAPPDAAHATVTKNQLVIEITQIGDKVYFHSPDALREGFGSSDVGQQLARGLADRWYTTKDAGVVDLTSFSKPSSVKANFLTTLDVSRKDNLDSNGVKVAELSTADYKAYITEASPHRLLVAETLPGKSIEILSNLKFAFTNYNEKFDIQAPTDVIDFDDHNTWPPFYQRVSVSASRCSTPCTLSATFQNYGGIAKAPAASYVLFTLSRTSGGGGDLGKCTKSISANVGYNKRVTVSCTIGGATWANYSGTYYYNAIVHNPAYE